MQTKMAERRTVRASFPRRPYCFAMSLPPFVSYTCTYNGGLFLSNDDSANQNAGHLLDVYIKHMFNITY